MREENKEKPTFKHAPVVSLNKPEIFERLAVANRDRNFLESLREGTEALTTPLSAARDDIQTIVSFALNERDEKTLREGNSYTIEVHSVQLEKSTPKLNFVRAYGKLVQARRWYDRKEHQLVTSTGSKGHEKEFCRVSAESVEVIERGKETDEMILVTNIVGRDGKLLHSYRVRNPHRAESVYEDGVLFTNGTWADEDVTLERPATPAAHPVDFLVHTIRGNDLIIRALEYFSPNGEYLHEITIGKFSPEEYKRDVPDVGNRFAKLRADEKVPFIAFTAVKKAPVEVPAAETIVEPEPEEESALVPTPEEVQIVFIESEAFLGDRILEIVEETTEEGTYIQYLRGDEVVAEEASEQYLLARELGQR